MSNHKAAMRRSGGGWARMWCAAVLGGAVLVGAPSLSRGQDAKRSASTLEEGEAKRLEGEVARLHDEGKLDAAIPLAERLLAIREKALGREHPALATPLNNLAALYATQRDYAKAEPLYLRSLAIDEKALGSEHPDVATSLITLAKLYAERRDYAKAEPFLWRAIEIREKTLGREHPETARSYNTLAWLYEIKGDYVNAELLSKRVLASFEKALGPEHLEIAIALINLAGTYKTKGDYTKAEPLFRRGLAIFEKTLGPEHADMATPLNNLAMLYAMKGGYAQAEPLFRRALAISEKVLGPEHPEVATFLNNLAQLCAIKGDYAQAEPLFRRTHAIWEKVLGPEDPNVAVVLSNLAGLYRNKGDFARAEPLFRRAQAILEKARPGHPDVAKVLNNLADLYKAKGDYAQAEPLFWRAFAILEKTLGPEHPDAAAPLVNLGLLYQSKGDDAVAEMLLRDALAILEKALGPEHPEVAVALNNLAQLYQKKGDYAEAEPLFRRALAIREKALGPESPGVAISLSNLASLHLASGDLTEALRRLERATAVDDRNAAVVLMTGADEQKRAYMDTLKGTTDGVVSLNVQFALDGRKAKRLALGTILNRKGRVLDAMADSFATLRRRVDPAERAELDRLRSLSAEYSALVLRGPGDTPFPEYRKTLARLDVQRQTLEDDLSRRNTALQIELRPISIEQVQAALPEGAALVELFRYKPFDPKAGRFSDRWGEPRYVAYIIRREGEIALADLGKAALIEAAVDALLPKLRRAAADPKPAARALDALVMEPIRRLLGDARWVFLSPDGALNLVPFAALRDEDDNYLIDRYAFTYVTSGRDLVRMKAWSTPPQRPVIIAAPDFNVAAIPASAPAEKGQRSADMGKRSFGSLPFAVEEGRALGLKLLEARLIMGAEATESAVKELHGPQLLHIATHGFFMPDQPELRASSFDQVGFDSAGLRGGMHQPRYAENPLLRSGLVFAGVNGGKSGKDDGVLTALEAAQLNLDGTKVVVLSACETAVGEARSGEGVYGLRRALVIAGAEAQVMSLWKVNDAVTREQMEAYYTGLLQGGGRSEAMRQVQLAMRRDPQRAHPYYWASFIVSGNPGALDGAIVAPKVDPVSPGMRGCSCEVGASSQGGAAAWALGFAALGLGWARRRRDTL